VALQKNQVMNISVVSDSALFGPKRFGSQLGARIILGVARHVVPLTAPLLGTQLHAPQTYWLAFITLRRWSR
jgi:hypothetical protein